MTVFEEIVDSIVEAFSSFLESLSCRVQEWQRRRDLIKEKKRYSDALMSSEVHYEPEEPDKELALRVVSYLEKIFPHGMDAHLRSLSLDERKDLMCQIANDTAHLFGVKPVNFQILYPTTDEEFVAFGCGFYSEPDNLLCINGAYILNDNIAFTKEQIFTIFHEMEHARQFSAMAGEKKYGYSEQLVNEWRYNISVYIRNSECDEAYRKQAMERDAFGLENMIRELYTLKMKG